MSTVLQKTFVDLNQAKKFLQQVVKLYFITINEDNDGEWRYLSYPLNDYIIQLRNLYGEQHLLRQPRDSYVGYSFLGLPIKSIIAEPSRCFNNNTKIQMFIAVDTEHNFIYILNCYNVLLDF